MICSACTCSTGNINILAKKNSFWVERCYCGEERLQENNLYRRLFVCIEPFIMVYYLKWNTLGSSNNEHQAYILGLLGLTYILGMLGLTGLLADWNLYEINADWVFIRIASYKEHGGFSVSLRNLLFSWLYSPASHLGTLRAAVLLHPALFSWWLTESSVKIFVPSVKIFAQDIFFVYFRFNSELMWFSSYSFKIWCQ